MVWTGEAVYLWEAELARLDLATGEWTRLPEPPLEVGSEQWTRGLRAFDGKLLVVGTSGACQGLALALWGGREWRNLPTPDLGGPTLADCITPRQVAVVEDSILVWYEGFDAFTFKVRDAEWTYVGQPTLLGSDGDFGAVVMGDRVLIPEFGQAALYDPAASTWTRLRLPGWGTDWEMVWTGEEVLMWGVTQCCPESGAPVDAWRWTPPGS
jgi:hypothetical protein